PQHRNGSFQSGPGRCRRIDWDCRCDQHRRNRLDRTTFRRRGRIRDDGRVYGCEYCPAVDSAARDQAGEISRLSCGRRARDARRKKIPGRGRGRTPRRAMYGALALTALSRLLLAALSGLLALLAGLLLSAAALLSALAALLSALLTTVAAVLSTLAALLLPGLLFVRIVHGYSLCCPPQRTTNPRRLSSCAGWLRMRGHGQEQSSLTRAGRQR